MAARRLRAADLTDAGRRAGARAGRRRRLPARGPTGAHKLENRTEEPARLVIFSSKGPLDIVHYPDSGKLGAWTADRGYIAITPEQPDVDYWEVEG
jgi:uncharacterized cupin superfamily protein